MSNTLTLLNDFLRANATQSTISILRLETLVQAQRMLELHATIVQQLVNLELLPQCRPDGSTSSKKMKTRRSLQRKPMKPHVRLAFESGEFSFVLVEALP